MHMAEIKWRRQWQITFAVTQPVRAVIDLNFYHRNEHDNNILHKVIFCCEIWKLEGFQIKSELSLGIMENYCSLNSESNKTTVHNVIYCVHSLLY
jgi:hypothetical protein